MCTATRRCRLRGLPGDNAVSASSNNQYPSRQQQQEQEQEEARRRQKKRDDDEKRRRFDKRRRLSTPELGTEHDKGHWRTRPPERRNVADPLMNGALSALRSDDDDDDDDSVAAIDQRV
ncbi:unnamed protein product [Heligmosomoides polygyrus]|uniref:IBB domain-containing protein n=1 Tax=Heligmosomoides polygyrus TaxID=6339 RepID=A0A183FNJ7_HELPZ|nr:unnamed protein product [Heligmosomoides polygyrus]